MKSYDFSVEYDVVVVGAGVAGVAAALASARRGLKTCLVEKTIMNGGLATIGSVLYYLPISDIHNQQVIFGLSEELLRASMKYGPGEVPDWHKPGVRYGCSFNPMSFVMAMDELLSQAGVILWYDTLLCDTEVENNTVKAIVVENKSGRGRIAAKAFVDTTGDADIAKKSGAETMDGVNYIAIWGVGYSYDAAEEAVETKNGAHLCQLIGWGASDTGSGAIPGIEPFVGINGKEVSRFVVQSRELALNAYKEMQQSRENGRNYYFPAMLPTMPNYRMSRHISAKYTLNTGEKFKQFHDAVAVAPDWRGGADIWCLPYRSLLHKDYRGFLSAGRCAGTHGEAWQVFRVIQTAAQTGEVAGLAASMAAERGIDPWDLNVPDLQNELKKRGFLLDMRELSVLSQPVRMEDED